MVVKTLGAFCARHQLPSFAIERWMLAVLDLDPVRLPAGAVGAIAVLGNHSLESDQVCVTKQVRTDLASFERRN